MLQTLSSMGATISKMLARAPDEIYIALKNPESVSRALRKYRGLIINPEPIIYDTLGIDETLKSTKRDELLFAFVPDIKEI